MRQTGAHSAGTRRPASRAGRPDVDAPLRSLGQSEPPRPDLFIARYSPVNEVERVSSPGTECSSPSVDDFPAWSGAKSRMAVDYEDEPCTHGRVDIEEDIADSVDLDDIQSLDPKTREQLLQRRDDRTRRKLQQAKRAAQVLGQTVGVFHSELHTMRAASAALRREKAESDLRLRAMKVSSRMDRRDSHERAAVHELADADDAEPLPPVLPQLRAELALTRQQLTSVADERNALFERNQRLQKELNATRSAIRTAGSYRAASARPDAHAARAAAAAVADEALSGGCGAGVQGPSRQMSGTDWSEASFSASASGGLIPSDAAPPAAAAAAAAAAAVSSAWERLRVVASVRVEVAVVALALWRYQIPNAGSTESSTAVRLAIGADDQSVTIWALDGPGIRPTVRRQIPSAVSCLVAAQGALFVGGAEASAVELTKDNFKEKLAGKGAIVKFLAPW